MNTLRCTYFILIVLTRCAPHLIHPTFPQYFAIGSDWGEGKAIHVQQLFKQDSGGFKGGARDPL